MSPKKKLKDARALALKALPDHEAAYSINAYAEAAHLFALASAKADEKGAKNFL